MIGKLRKKFIIAAIIAVFLVLFVLIGSINVLNYRSLTAQADETLQILASNRGSFPTQMFREEDLPTDGPMSPDNGGGPPPDDAHDGPLDSRRGSRELAYQSRYYAVWFSEDGVSTRINLDNLASLTEESALSMAEAVYSSGKAKGFSGEYRYCRTADNDETLLLFLNCEREFQTFRSFLYVSIAISLIGTVAVFLLLLFISGRIVRPIAESYEKQKRFITDAGHELKTPITIIQADADVLQSEMEEENEWISDILRQTRRLSELTADLIYLSKLEEENAPLMMQDLSLTELVEETAQSFQSLALTKGKTFRSSIVPALTVTGDEKSLAKLVSILLDNAMKYSPENGTVELILGRLGKNAQLIIKNDADNIKKGNADWLFDRFTRGDSSRNSDSGGFGLGLAIAKAVAEAHKGRIHAESEDGLSLTVTVDLPLSNI